MAKSYETAEDIYANAETKAKEGAEKAQQKIDDLMQSTQKKVNASWEDLKQYCRNHPAQALGIALGAGALVGAALTRAFSRSETPTEHKVRQAMRTGQETWEQVKGGFEQAISGLRGAVEKFR